jgi:putative acetyltransferase
MRSVIREEAPGDAAAIHRLNTAAFETDAEAKLVDALRAARALTLSLVVEVDGEIVGHIAFSPVVVDSAQHTIDDGDASGPEPRAGSTGAIHGVGLAPMAVAPAYQRQGIGGRLINDGLRRLCDTGHRFCVVLGHAEYYPRHGFMRASQFGMRWERSVPDDVFFVCELAPEGLAGVSGTVRYRAEFDSV